MENGEKIEVKLSKNGLGHFVLAHRDCNKKPIKIKFVLAGVTSMPK